MNIPGARQIKQNLKYRRETYKKSSAVLKVPRAVAGDFQIHFKATFSQHMSNRQVSHCGEVGEKPGLCTVVEQKENEQKIS